MSEEKIHLSSPVYIARNFSECYNCLASIPVVSLAAEKFSIYNKTETGFNEDSLTFFYMPIYLGEELSKVIRNKFDYYRPFYSNTIKEEYWANHCIYCGKGQGDFYLHAEPGGAFFPEEIEDFKNIELIPLNLKSNTEIEASYSTKNDLKSILKYARVISIDNI